MIPLVPVAHFLNIHSETLRHLSVINGEQTEVEGAGLHIVVLLLVLMGEGGLSCLPVVDPVDVDCPTGVLDLALVVLAFHRVGVHGEVHGGVLSLPEEPCGLVDQEEVDLDSLVDPDSLEEGDPDSLEEVDPD